MTTHKEALKLALELLAVGTFHSPELQAKRTKVIEQGLEALAQPEREPKHVATVAEVHMSRYTIEWTNGPLPEGAKLYDAPQPKEPEQEPVALESILGAIARGWCYEKNANKTIDKDLAEAIAKEVYALVYTTPPQRKPLTGEKAQEILQSERCWFSNRMALIITRAIEAAHGIKGDA